MCVIGSLAVIPTVVFLSDTPLPDSKVWDILKKYLLILVALGFGISLVPSSQELAAVHILPKIANQQEVQNLPPELVTLAVEWLKELKPKN